MGEGGAHRAVWAPAPPPLTSPEAALGNVGEADGGAPVVGSADAGAPPAAAVPPRSELATVDTSYGVVRPTTPTPHQDAPLPLVAGTVEERIVQRAEKKLYLDQARRP